MNVAANNRAVYPASAGEPSAGLDRLDRIGAIRHLAPHESLALEGDSANRFHRVLSGTVAGYKATADGRRQIVAFFFPGDLVGLTTVSLPASITRTEPKRSVGQASARFPVPACESSLGNRRRCMKTCSWPSIGRLPQRKSDCCGSVARRRGSGSRAFCWNALIAPGSRERTAGNPFRYR